MTDETIVIEFIGGQLVVEQDFPSRFIGKRIAQVKQRGADISAPLRAFRSDWQKNNLLIFSAEGIPKWPSLSPAYAAAKARLYPGKTILRRTDALYASLVSDTGDSVYEVGPRSLKAGTMVTYSKYHRVRRPHVQLLQVTFDKLNRSVFEYIRRPLTERQ